MCLRGYTRWAFRGVCFGCQRLNSTQPPKSVAILAVVSPVMLLQAVGFPMSPCMWTRGACLSKRLKFGPMARQDLSSGTYVTLRTLSAMTTAIDRERGYQVGDVCSTICLLMFPLLSRALSLSPHTAELYLRPRLYLL